VSRPLAAIDLGSNTIRLLVAEADAATGLRPIWAEQVIARLGEGLTRRDTLAPVAMERALAAVRAFRDRAATLGAAEVLVVATAAVRDAANRDEFLARLRPEPRLHSRVVSGEEEARLTLLGVLWGLGGVIGPFCLLDIGGGSTEFLVGRDATVLAAVSLRLGVVALCERFFHTDPVDRTEYDACAAHVGARLTAEAWPTIRPLGPRALVGTAGTITTLAALDLGLASYDPMRVQGHRLTVEAVDALRLQLGALPLNERAQLPCLEPGRADLIVPGIAIALAALRGLGHGALTVADTGFREGILLDAAGWSPPVRRAEDRTD